MAKGKFTLITPEELASGKLVADTERVQDLFKWIKENITIQDFEALTIIFLCREVRSGKPVEKLLNEIKENIEYGLKNDFDTRFLEV